MIRRAIEISGERRHLMKHRGFLVVCEEDRELGRLPLDDLEVVLAASRGLTCTGSLLNELARRCIPLVTCDQRFLPTAILWPVESHTLQTAHIQAQARLSLPRRKRLWQQLVQAKIRAQADTLRLCVGEVPQRLEHLAKNVRSGDPTNAEGEAARIYWPRLFGDTFRRDQEEDGINALLNYAYTVLRSGVARAVMLAGLHPAFGLHHCNLRDTMPLVDDLIEPFRPVADVLVFELAGKAADPPQLTPEVKEQLTRISTIDMTFQGATSPLSECLLRMTRSLVEVCRENTTKLLLPEGIRAEE